MTETTRATQGYVDKGDVTLKEHLESRICNLEKTLNERFVAQEKATHNALVANEKRLDSMNEFRETLRDQTKSYVTKAESNVIIDTMCHRIKSLEDIVKDIQISDAVLAGKASQSATNLALLIAIISLIISVAMFFII